MNVSLAQDLSLYHLIATSENGCQPSSVSPATLLAMVRSQIDIMIEQQIPATVWAKLPAGNIWQSELLRYQQKANPSAKIYTCHLGESQPQNSVNGVSETSLHLPIYFPSDKLQREYFWIVLSPQFCSLIVALRPSRGVKKQKSLRAIINKEPNTKPNTKPKPKPYLVTMTSFDSKLVGHVVESFQQVFTQIPSIQPIIDPDIDKLNFPHTTEPAILNSLLVRQMQKQEEIHRKRTKLRLGKLQQQNQHLRVNLQEKDVYLNHVCQEIRTPLTHMKTALSLLNSPALKPPQRQRYLQMLHSQCDRQNSLITSVLELVELERNLKYPNFEAVHLSDIIPGVVSTYQPLAQEKGIMLAYTVPTDLPPVWFVHGGLKQIAINLLGNSIKFTTNGGQVWVKARLQGAYILLEVRDTGIGIAESEISRIFDRFYSTRPPIAEESGGGGLGLTVVQQYLQRCGGAISVKSKQTEGSTFTVQLAICQRH
ncbi:DICT sensory domain-containing protein [Brunnivagina elsteri]|uniref:histidine kinase n=1 Tax=Brunnivagina elsteri CCALA 953 TaxID=987040 RepID=A0A2A2THK2_9CYAN|nr:DICT sensory domain-containing protein [Calothrix elsteri]PAX53108.1 ATPase [Calothrix elsteri CCALA 953]